MDKNDPLQPPPESAEMFKPIMDSVRREINHLKRVIYDLHTRDRYSEARKASMSDEEIDRRNRLIAKVLGLDPQTLAKEGER